MDDGGLFDMEPVVQPRKARKSRRGGTEPERGATPYAGPATPATTPATPYTPAEELQDGEPLHIVANDPDAPIEVWNAANPSMGIPVTIDRSLQKEGGCAKYDGCPTLPRCVLCPSSLLYWRTASDYTDRKNTADRSGYKSVAHPRTCER